MLTRLYIDNFRCFEKFEWKAVERKQLILGRNGTGKSSLMEALVYIGETVVSGERADKWFRLDQRTRWLDQREQIFEIEAQLDRGKYSYRLVIEPWGEPARPRVQSEKVRLNDKPIFEFENGEVVIYPVGEGLGSSMYQLDQSRSALSTISPDSRMREILDLRQWLETVSCWQINPLRMGSHAESEDVKPKLNLTNFAAWYRHLVQAHPRENMTFLKDLRESLDGFDQLRLASAGENVRILYADFLRDVRIAFHELSDGQRYLVCLYAIMHFVVAKGGTVIIDEPDNFISLREIQPWLMAIEDMADDHKGQVILISHHPEILNQWAGPYGVQFIRDGAGPVRVEKFKGDPESPLSAAELVARGWDLE